MTGGRSSLSISVAVADKGYDSEENHVLVRELSFRSIAYSMHRLTNLVIFVMRFYIALIFL